MLSAALALLSRPVSGILFPYPLGTTLHAARISLVFHTAVKSNKSQHSWGTHILGFLLMCWGGSIASHVLLSLPPPQLYMLGPWINYSAVHLCLTFIFQYIPVPDPAQTNLLLFPLDGLLRANSVLQTLSLLSRPSVSPLLVQSPLFHFILGMTASAGGGLLGGTLSLTSETWTFSTPPPLRTGAFGLWSTHDMWAGGIVAVIYGSLTSHPAFANVLSVTLSTSSARASSVAVMIAFFGARSFATKPRKLVQPPKEKVKTQ